VIYFISQQPFAEIHAHVGYTADGTFLYLRYAVIRCERRVLGSVSAMAAHCLRMIKHDNNPRYAHVEVIPNVFLTKNQKTGIQGVGGRGLIGWERSPLKTCSGHLTGTQVIAIAETLSQNPPIKVSSSAT
jgi:hypothetical protein